MGEVGSPIFKTLFPFLGHLEIKSNLIWSKKGILFHIVKIAQKITPPNFLCILSEIFAFHR